LEVELTGLRDRRAEVLDADRSARAVAIREAGTGHLGSTAVSEIAFESGHAVRVDRAKRDSWDVTAAVGAITVAANGAIPVRETDPEIICNTRVCVGIAERVRRAIEVAQAGNLDLALHGFGPVDRAAGEEQNDGEKGARA